MIALLCFVLNVLISPFKSKSRLEAENAALRHQVVVLRRIVLRRVRLTNNDRLFFVQLYRWFPSVLKVITVIRPETLLRWHRAGFRCYWRCRDGAPSCATTRRTSPPWTCSLSRHLASTCSTPSSSSGWTGETSSGST